MLIYYVSYEHNLILFLITQLIYLSLKIHLIKMSNKRLLIRSISHSTWKYKYDSLKFNFISRQIKNFSQIRGSIGKIRSRLRLCHHETSSEDWLHADDGTPQEYPVFDWKLLDCAERTSEFFEISGKWMVNWSELSWI